MKNLLITLPLFLFFIISCSSVSADQTEIENHAGLVIQFGDESLRKFCIDFSEESITGDELLKRSELSIVFSYQSQGVAVCKIEGEGCPVETCFCQSPPDYWSFWVLDSGEWVYAPLGSNSKTVNNGEVNGWVWGPGNPPPLTEFEQICPPATLAGTSGLE